MSSKQQKRNLFIAYIVLFSFIIWGTFFNDNEKENSSSNTSLSNEQIKILSNSLIRPTQGDMPTNEYLKMKEVFEKDFIVNFLDSFKELSTSDKKLIGNSFKKFYHNQIKLKKLFEEELIYKFMERNISYKYDFTIKTISEYNIYLKLFDNHEEKIVFKIDFEKKEKEYSSKYFSKEYIKVYLPYINTTLYTPLDKKIVVEKMFNLLENSAKQLKLINEKLKIRK
ncbi:hypothetical protein [Poseidonibacter lekithochrous]|uniref:hypothetical protein n=1 Tax=Poseidonibacter lekithochrous TaxID=1904463 RepID=UPI0008FC4514|nr:hypothetical protein [Poseidonibacter lekithochrous]QKJ23277.1 hypothetical protein ALEK_2014 [Poseidonibacter lekithochrous]